MLVDEFRTHGLDPKRVSSMHGGEYASACPRCGGEDRFRIWPSRQADKCEGVYWCRQCDCHGDAIQFCRDFLDMTYKEALEYVGVSKCYKSGWSDYWGLR